MDQKCIDKAVIVIAPIVVGLLVGIIVRVSEFGNNNILMDGEEILKTLMAVWGTLLGFLLTAATLSLTASNTMVDMLRRTGHYKSVLLSYVITSVYMLFAILFSLILFLFNIWSYNLFCILVGIVAVTLSSLLIGLCFLFNIILRGNR